MSFRDIQRERFGMSDSETPAVGIDLGTTYSVIAHLDAQGRPRTLSNAEGDLTTPSVLFFERDSVVVGKEAVKAATLEPECVAEFAKRDMGNATYGRPIRGRFFPPEVVQSFLLRKLREDAELVLGPFSKVVITVPAYFNEPRRKATQDTATLAGLEAIDIINEPTAAAIAYGVQQGFLNERGAANKHEKLLVYDLGGGTFDVTLMQLDGADFTTLATAGDVYLGGIDWDRRIVDWLSQNLQERFGGADPCEDDAALHRLMREAEDLKRALSVRSEAQIKLEWHEQVWRGALSRVEFERLTGDLVERTRFTIRNLLAEANLQWSDITRLLLTGGSTRMPMIQEMLRAESGLPVDRSLSADEAVAHGAAIYAGFLLRRDGAAVVPQSLGKVVNVNSHPLGVLGYEPETGRPRCRVLIPRNTPLPTKRASRFATRRNDQRSVVVNVVEGGDASGQNATAIGKCVVSDLPAGLPANTPVSVVFHYAENGRLTVDAEVPGAGRRATLDIERASGLTPELLDEWAVALRDGHLFDASEDQDEGQFVFTEEPGDDQPPGSDVALEEGASPPPLPTAWPADDTVPVDQAGTDTWDFGESERAADDAPDDDLDDFLRQLK